MVNFQIPDEALEQLRFLLEKDGEMQWTIGQFIVDYWQETLKYVKPEEIRDAHAELIRQFARGTGAARSTLRDREKMRLFFTDADLAEFPMFTYHQWRALRSAGEKWREWAIKASDDNWSVEKIRHEIKGEATLDVLVTKRLDEIDKKVRKILDDNTIPAYIHESLSLIPSIIQDTRELL